MSGPLVEKEILLSICMPTLNFAEYIGATLESIVSQATHEVEIVVVDGASTDNTSEIVAKWSKKFPRINYIRRVKNMGLDRDLAESVEQARGQYCWLMGSDDIIMPGAIARVLNEIRTGNDLYLLNPIFCDRSMRHIGPQHWLLKHIGDRVFHLSSEAELLEYFNSAYVIGALFSYIGSIVIRRDRWNEADEGSRPFVGTCYAHVARLFSLYKTGLTLKYIRDPFVLNRLENDSFAKDGKLRRCLIDFDGYGVIGDKLFPDPKLNRAFKYPMHRVHSCWSLALLRKAVTPDKEWKHLLSQLEHFYYPPWKIWVVQFLSYSSFTRKFICLARCAGDLLFFAIDTLPAYFRFGLGKLHRRRDPRTRSLFWKIV